MIRPLLRVLPSLSGNVKLVCDLDNYHKISQNDYECFVRSARLSPLSSNLFNKFIGVSLLQSSYEWDLRKFFINYSDYFWESHFNYSKIDLLIYDNTETNKTRNIDFEFGAKRISYSKNNKQFAFFAPIYIDNVNDIPDYFEMTFDISNGLYRSSKKVKVNLSNKSDNPENYLFNYIEHYVKQIDDNVIFCLPNDKQATYWGVDLKSGGFTKISDNTFIKLLKKQTTILNFDNVLCKGFERNNIVIRQVLPFCFYFNINDILSETEKQKYQYSRIDISGKWYKNGKEIDVYDWDIDYTEYYQTIKTLNTNTGLMEYDYLTYQNDKGEKVIQNIMDISYPALRDSIYDNYRFSNKITPNFCRWKLKYSSDEHPYITNMNVAFSLNQNSLTRYKEFPVKTENTSGLVHTLKQDSKLFNNLILPLTSENIKIYNKYHKQEYNEYKYIQNNFASNWFELMNPSLGVNECITSNDSFCTVKDNKVYFNGILYDLQKIYDTFADVPKIDKFGVFITLKYNPITRKNLDKFLYTDNVIFKQFGKYVKTANTFINDNILTDSDTQLYSKLDTSLKTDEIAKNNIFVFNDKNTGDFINLSDFNIDYYELNHYFKQEDLEQIIDKNLLPHENRFFNGNEFIPINKISQIINEQNNGLIIDYLSLEDNPLLCSSKDNYSVINFTPEILSKTEISEKNSLSFYQKHNFISKKDLKDILKTTYSEADSLVDYISNNCYHYVWNPILTDNSSFTYAKNCFVKIEGFNARFYGDTIEKDKVKYDNDVLYIDPFNYNNIIDHYNNTWLKYSDEKFSYINFSGNGTQNKTLSDYINKIDKVIDYILQNDYVITHDFDQNYIHDDIKRTFIRWQLDVKQIIGSDFKGENAKINNTALSTTSINNFTSAKEWLRFWFLNGWFPVSGYKDVPNDVPTVIRNSDLLSNECLRVLFKELFNEEFNVEWYNINDSVNAEVYEDIANTYVTTTDNELEIIYKKLRFNGTSFDVAGDTISKDTLDDLGINFTAYDWISNWALGNIDNEVYSVSHFNRHVRDFGKMQNAEVSESMETNIDTLNSINWYGKFLNKAHLQYFIQYIYDDPNASGVRRKKSVTDIYVRKRFMYDDNNLKIHDVYIPLSEYFNFRDLDNISDTDYNRLINDIVGSIDYNEDDKYFYFNTLNIKNKINIVKFNYDESLDGEISDNIIHEQFLDKLDHLINNVELGKTEPQHFKFDLCFKKTFVKMNKEIYQLINLEEELNAPYKDLYVYEFEKDFEYNNNCKIYHILNRYETVKDTKEVIAEPFYKYLSSERECLKPLFNNIFMEDKENAKIYCEYSLDNLETDVRVIDNNDNVIDTFVRHNKNNALCLFDISSFNLDANGNVALEKPITIANKNYFTYTYWSNYLTEEQQQKSAYLYPTYDRYSSKKTYFSQFEITKDVSYYYSESVTKTRDVISYTYYTKSAWESLTDRPINYDYFFDNEKLMYIYSTWRIKTEEYEEILIKPGKRTYTYVLDDLGLFDSFKLNTYSYFNTDTNKTEIYAFYLINVELNNTSSSLNIIKDKDEYVKFIDLINGKDVSENNFIYDIYKQILPFTKNNPLDTLYSGENLMVIPKYYKFPVNYIATSYYDKNTELHNDIVFLPKPHDNIVLERYFDNIVPLFRQTDSFNSYLLKYKNVNKTFAHSYHTNEVIEKEFISIKNYPGVTIIDVNTNKEIKREYDLEYKHYNDNRVYNLPESFDIEIKQLLTYEDLLIAQTKQNTLEQFKKYIYQHSKNQFVDNQILFLFNRYKVDYLHSCDGLTIDLTAKLYKLVYRFTLL